MFLCFQAGWGGGRSLPAGFALPRHRRGAGRGERFGLRLPPSASQCPGPTGAHTCRVVTAEPQPRGRHTRTAEATHRGEGAAATVASKFNGQTQIEMLKTTHEFNAVEYNRNINAVEYNRNIFRILRQGRVSTHLPWIFQRFSCKSP